MYFFLPFGVGPLPGWNYLSVKGVLRAAWLERPFLRVIDILRGRLSVNMARFLGLLTRVGVHPHTREGERRRKFRALRRDHSRRLFFPGKGGISIETQRIPIENILSELTRNPIRFPTLLQMI